MLFIYLLQFSYFFFAVVSEQGNVIFIKELQVKNTATVYLKTQPVCSTVSRIWNTKLPKLKEICKYHIDTCVYKIISVPILIPWFLWLHTCQRWSRLHYIYQGNGADLCTQLHLCGQNCQAHVVLGQQHYAQSHSWGCQDWSRDHGAVYPCSTAGTPPQARQLHPCQHCHPSTGRERVPIDETDECQWQRRVMD